MSEVVTISKPKRPFSVWLITGGNTLLAVFVLASSFKGSDWSIPAPQVALWVVLGLALWISTASTWLGSRWGRVIMLALITLYMGAILVGAIGQISHEVTVQSSLTEQGRHYSTSSAYMIRLVGRAAYSLAWLVANYWLLFGKRARAFFA